MIKSKFIFIRYRLTKLLTSLFKKITHSGAYFFLLISKHRFQIISALCLLIIILIGVQIRLANLHLLQDNEGNWTPLGSDSFFTLRYTKALAIQKLSISHDSLRYAPIGHNLSVGEQILPHLIALLYRISSIFISNLDLDLFVILSPVLLFALSLTAYFFLIKLLTNSCKIALLASAILAISRPFLFPTIAGSSGIEALGFLMTIICFYCFVQSVKSDILRCSVFLGLVAGIINGLIIGSWHLEGLYVFIIILTSIGIFFLINQIKRKQLVSVFALFTGTIIAVALSYRTFNTFELSKTLTVLWLSGCLLTVIGIKVFLEKRKFPKFLIIFFVVVFLIFLSWLFMHLFINDVPFDNIFKSIFIYPIQNTKLNQSVAANNPSYFDSWRHYLNHNSEIMFLLLCSFIIILFRDMAKNILIKKYCAHLLSLSYIIMLSGIILSRYSPTVKSEYFFWVSLVQFIILALIIYLYRYYKEKRTYELISNFPKASIFLLVWLFWATILARSARGFFFFYSPIFAISIAYVLFKIFYKTKTFDVDSNHFLIKKYIFKIGVGAFIALPFYLLSQSLEIFSMRHDTPVWIGGSLCIIAFFYGFLKSSIWIKLKKRFTWIRYVRPRHLIFLIIVEWYIGWAISLHEKLYCASKQLIIAFLTNWLVVLTLLLPVIGVITVSLFKYRTFKFLKWVAITLMMFLIVVSYYSQSKAAYLIARNTKPIFSKQWKNTLFWLKNHTPKESVIASWWDFGAWIQSKAERRTIIDSGHKMPNWESLFSRSLITSRNDKEALDFLNRHKASHILISAWDIENYNVLSWLGSDDKSAQFDYVAPFYFDERNSELRKKKDNKLLFDFLDLKEDYKVDIERDAGSDKSLIIDSEYFEIPVVDYEAVIRRIKKDSGCKLAYIYSAGGFYLLEDDITFNGDIYKAGEFYLNILILPIKEVIEDKSIECLQPRVLITYKNKAVMLPIRYLFIDRLIDFSKSSTYQKGLESCVYVLPRLKQERLSSSREYNIDKTSLALYISNKALNGLWIRLYLNIELNNPNFVLTKAQPPYFPSQIYQPKQLSQDIMYCDGIIGPIKIWRVVK